MSKYVDVRYELERRQRQELFDQRVREKTRSFIDRYSKVLADVDSQGLREYVGSEYEVLQGEVGHLARLVESDPASARDASIELGNRIHALPRLARAMRQEAARAEREAEQQRVEMQIRAREEIELTWQHELAAWSDPYARRLAFAALGQLRARLMGPGSRTTVDELRAAMSNVRQVYELKSQETRIREANLAEAEAAAHTVQQCRDDIKLERGPAAERAQELGAALAGLGEATPDEVSRRLVAIARELDAAVVDESCRREVVQAVYRALEDAGFVIEKPRIVRDADSDEVVIVARRPAGAQAIFKIELSGRLNYKFDHYRGSECKKDIDAVLPRLQSVYGIKLSDDRVLWQNPDDTDSEARPQPGMTREK
jgi:hypothetical protein